MDVIESNMFISFQSLGHMDEFNDLAKDKPHSVQQILNMSQHTDVFKRVPSTISNNLDKEQRESLQIHPRKSKIPDFIHVNNNINVNKIIDPERNHDHSHSGHHRERKPLSVMDNQVEHELELDENVVPDRRLDNSQKERKAKENKYRWNKKASRKRCGACVACMRDNCGSCLSWLDMPKKNCPNINTDNAIPVRNEEVKDFSHTAVEQMERNGRKSGKVHKELKEQREPVYATSKSIKMEYPDVAHINYILDVERKVNDDIPEKFQVHPHSEDAPRDISGQKMGGKKKVAIVHELPQSHIRDREIPVHPCSEDHSYCSIHVVDLITKQVEHVLDPIENTLLNGRLVVCSEEKKRKGNKKPRARRCGACAVCMRDNCGNCRSCLDMPMFGGRGKLKKGCIKKICPNTEYSDNTKL